MFVKVFKIIFLDLKLSHMRDRYMLFFLGTSKLNKFLSWFPSSRVYRICNMHMIRNLLKCVCTKTYQNWAKFDLVIAKIYSCSFLPLCRNALTCVVLGLVEHCKSNFCTLFYLTKKSSLNKENRMAICLLWLSTYHVQLRPLQTTCIKLSRRRSARYPSFARTASACGDCSV